MPLLKLIQLPVPPPAAYAATGNVPLAAGYLAVAAKKRGLEALGLEIEVVEPNYTDVLGDALILDLLLDQQPDYIGFSLYLWNSERSIYLAKEIKKRAPNTLILIGGPEVSPDNPFIIENATFDIAVTGEAEAVFAELMSRLLQHQDISDLPAVALKKDGQFIPFNPQGKIDFPLSDYPSPYLEDLIPVQSNRSTYIESVRGCRSKCTYCFYPRSSNVLRSLDVEATIDMLVKLKQKGAREIVFLDPTLNHRPEFAKLLERIAQINEDQQLSFFGEIRAEGMTVALAQMLKKAGFHKLEIGLQSVNTETLAKVKRFGKPDKVAEVAQFLKANGIEPLVDLIVGLPNDTAEDVRKGFDFLKDHDLAEFAQVFPLSLLPGTELRNTVIENQIAYDPAPPYRLIHTNRISQEEIKTLLDEAEDRLDRRIDEYPRPHLVNDDPRFERFRHDLDQNSKTYIKSIKSLLSMIPDRFEIDLDQLLHSNQESNQEQLKQLYYPSARHTSIWFKTTQIEKQLVEIKQIIDIRLSIDPYATLDVVIVPRTDFDLGVIDYIEYLLNQAPPSYLSRSQAHRGVNMQRRLHIVLNHESKEISKGFKKKLVKYCSVYEQQSVIQALANADRLGFDQPAALIQDQEISKILWDELISNIDPESIAFCERILEKKWCAEVLEYGL